MCLRRSVAVVTACLIWLMVAATYAAETPATAKNGSDDSASTVNLVPGWSCGPPPGVKQPKDAPSAKTLDLTGADNNYFYGSYGQLGPRGFFGDYDVDQSSTGLFANLNGWVGNPRLQAAIVPGVTPTATQPDIMSDLVSGTGASVSNVALTITPRYGNDWVDLKARYTINAYSTSAAPGAVVPIALPQLTLWWAKVSTPIADIALGKTIFQKGCSLQFSPNRYCRIPHTGKVLYCSQHSGLPSKCRSIAAASDVMV